jgi:uncharacterized protein (TIGR02757 family)
MPCLVGTGGPARGRLTPWEERLRDKLEEVRARCPVDERRALDPVRFVHGVADPTERELVALVASSCAFGNVATLGAKIAEALARLGQPITAAADDPREASARLAGWRHRVYRAVDLAELVTGGRAVQREAGSLGAALAAELDRRGGEPAALRPALGAWVRAIRAAGGLDRRSGAGAAHILADPEAGSAAKRLMLLLRWMVRPADGVDLGLWPVSPRLLVVPLDTHVLRLGQNLGLTSRRDASWRTAEEITATLRRLDPSDPVKYDFSLCHLGMATRCPTAPSTEACAGCGVAPICRRRNGYASGHRGGALACRGASIGRRLSGPRAPRR